MERRHRVGARTPPGAQQTLEAAAWVTEWLLAIERASSEREVDLPSLVHAAVEIVTLHWDDSASMREVMWRRLIDGIDDGGLCFDLWVEHVLISAATRNLGC